MRTVSLLHRLEKHAQHAPDRRAFVFLDNDGRRRELTQGELVLRSRAIARRIAELTSVGSRALLLFPSGLEFVEAFLACLYAGVVAVPAYPPKRNRSSLRLRAIADDCTPALVLTTVALEPLVRQQAAELFPSATILAVDSVNDRDAASFDLGSIRSESIAFLQYTSGSTGDPKGVIVTHDNIVANEMAIERSFGHRHDSCMVGWLPMFHDMGLIGMTLQPLFVGFPSVILSPQTFLRSPVTWLRAITEFRGTSGGGPNFGFEHCVKQIGEEEKVGLDLRSWETAYNGAEPVRAETLARFTSKFQGVGFRPEAFFPCFGMAETTLFATGGPYLRPPCVLHVDRAALEQGRMTTHEVPNEASQSLVSCGQVGDGMTMRVVDPESRLTLPPGQVGEIWVQGTSVTQGYWNKPEITESVCRATTTDDGAGPFLRTGDLGLIEDGELFITGRLKDVIIQRGRNLYPHDIEATIERVVDFVGPNACAAFALKGTDGEGIGLVLEASRALVSSLRNTDKIKAGGVPLPEMTELVERIQAAITDEFEVAVARIGFTRPGAFPRTSSGKVQRGACREALLSGAEEIIHLWPAVRSAVNGYPLNSDNGHAAHDASTLNRLHEVVVAFARRELSQTVDSLNCDEPLTNYGFDSLAAANLAKEIENRLRKRVTADVIYDCRTIRQLASYLDELGQSAVIAAVPANGEMVALPSSDGSTANVQRRRRGSKLLNRYRERLRHVDEMRDAKNYFYESPVRDCDGAYVQIGSQRLLMMSSYSYLGLLGHPEIRTAINEVVERLGGGSHGVRIVAGTTADHVQLEARIASLMNAQAALTFSSGFMTNVATISSLVGPGDVIVADEFIHASLVDGCRMSQAEVNFFRHNDIVDLRHRLAASTGKSCLVVVDGVYSMEGDVAPIPTIVTLCDEFDALLMVDEAHSMGVLGATGRGVQEHFQLSLDDIDVKMGTLSKALGSVGGYVAGSAELIDFLRHSARSYIFSGALAPPQVAAATKAIDLLVREPSRTAELKLNARRLIDGCRELGFRVPKTESAVVPLLCDTSEQALAFTKRCREQGVFVVPIVYPAVPINAPRIRTCAMANHTDADLEMALSVFATAGREVGLLPVGASPPPPSHRLNLRLDLTDGDDPAQFMNSCLAELYGWEQARCNVPHPRPGRQPEPVDDVKRGVPPAFEIDSTRIIDRIERANQRIHDMKRSDRYFFHSPISKFDGPWVTVDGRRMLMLSSYNYLGLSHHPHLIASAKHSLDVFGIGQQGSRLICGTTSAHLRLEASLAEFLSAESAIVFNSGYVTNVATIGALVGRGDVVIGDELNHASLADGVRFSGAQLFSFRHNDVGHLDELLRRESGRRVLVVLDAVYSMEGDIAPLPRIVDACKRHDVLLMVDEAHALGVLGATGRGVQEHFGLPNDAIDVKMATLSKALASFGGVVAAKRSFIDHLAHNARGYIFSGALPAVQVSGALAALEVVGTDAHLVQQVQRNAQHLRRMLVEHGLRVSGEGTPIIPILGTSTEQILDCVKHCREQGLFVVPVVYPAVPMNSPRIRLSVTADLTNDDLEFAATTLIVSARASGLIGHVDRTTAIVSG